MEASRSWSSDGSDSFPSDTELSTTGSGAGSLCATSPSEDARSCPRTGGGGLGRVPSSTVAPSFIVDPEIPLSHLSIELCQCRAEGMLYFEHSEHVFSARALLMHNSDGLFILVPSLLRDTRRVALCCLVEWSKVQVHHGSL